MAKADHEYYFVTAVFKTVPAIGGLTNFAYEVRTTEIELHFSVTPDDQITFFINKLKRSNPGWELISVSVNRH